MYFDPGNVVEKNPCKGNSEEEAQAFKSKTFITMNGFSKCHDNCYIYTVDFRD